MGSELIIGEMWSGKTSELFRRLDRAKHAGQTTILYKYEKDVRFGEDRASLASSHNEIHRVAIPISTLKNVDITPNTVIGIDEGQFIEGLVEFVESASNLGCKVIISALNCDYRRNGFPNIMELFPKCEEITRLHAICFNCKNESSFTQRINQSSEEIEIIGGSDIYRAVCRTCYNNK